MRDSLALLVALVVSLLVAAGAGAWFLFRTAPRPIDSPPPPATVTGATRSPSPDAVSSSHRSSPSQETEVPSARPPAPAADPDDPAKNAEPLPELPQADSKSHLTPLLPDKTLYLEKRPDGTKRVLFVAEVCVSKPPEVQVDPLLEVFLCRKNTKEHEAVLRADIDARFIHAALEAAGAVKGSPVRFVDPKTGAEDYKPATGGVVRVSVHYRKDGKLHTRPAQEWVRDKSTGKPMAHDWVFAGSRFVRNPDAPPTAPDYYCANNGEVIAVSNFPDSMLDLPVAVSRDNNELIFEADTAKIPPLLSKVWVILEPTGEKK